MGVGPKGVYEPLDAVQTIRERFAMRFAKVSFSRNICIMYICIKNIYIYIYIHMYSMYQRSLFSYYFLSTGQKSPHVPTVADLTSQCAKDSPIPVPRAQTNNLTTQLVLAQP